MIYCSGAKNVIYCGGAKNMLAQMSVLQNVDLHSISDSMALVLSKSVGKQLRYSVKTQKNAKFFLNISSLRAICRVFLFQKPKINHSIE